MLSSPAFRLLAGLLLVAALMFGAARWLESGRATEQPRAATVYPAHVAAPDYPRALAKADADIASARSGVARMADQWMPLEQLASALIHRARLTGDYGDYAAARATLDRALAVAPPGAGPHLTRAALALQTHRLADSEADLDAIARYAVPEPREIQSEVAALRGDIAFYRGRYAVALGYYERADTLAPSPGVAVRKANLYARTGAPNKALEEVARAAAMGPFTTARAAALLMLQRGQIELRRGEWAAAEAAFVAAARRFPGDPVIEAHVAQMYAARGDHDGALRRYAAILKRSPDPAIIDAVAAIYRARGDFGRTRGWAARSAARWDERLRLAPEAAYGHAYEHHLGFGDAKRALDLAARDLRARTYGGSALGYAWALLANGRAAEALDIARTTARTRWVAADLHRVAAQAHALRGQDEEAKAAREAALRIDPRAFDPAAALIRLGH